MRRYILLRLLALFISLAGCKNFKLSKDDLKWQPYEVGDLLVFESNTGEIDSIKIKSINSFFNTKDPLAIFSNQHEVLFVNGELLNPYNEPKYKEHVNFLKIFSDNTTSVFFNLKKISDTFDYGTLDYSINKLSNLYSKKKLSTV